MPTTQSSDLWSCGVLPLTLPILRPTMVIVGASNNCRCIRRCLRGRGKGSRSRKFLCGTCCMESLGRHVEEKQNDCCYAECNDTRGPTATRFPACLKGLMSLAFVPLASWRQVYKPRRFPVPGNSSHSNRSHRHTTKCTCPLTPLH